MKFYIKIDSMNLEQIVIENIKQIRKQKGISQEKLAEYCGTSTSYIGLMETYKNVPKLSTIERIAHALNVPPQKLFEENAKIESSKDAKKKMKKNVMKEFEKNLDAVLRMI